MFAMSGKRRVGVLWDMDGTLVDTEPLWLAAEHELIESFGGVWSHEKGMQLVGNGLLQSAVIIQEAGVRMEPLEIVRWLTDHVTAHLDPESMPWRPGARELLRSLRDARVPTALVTMSYRQMALEVAGQLGFVGFDAVIAGDDVAHEKPHPDPYLRGAAALGLEPGECVAIEDSFNGIRSAASAGTRAVAVPFLVPIPDDERWLKWDTLAGRTADDVLGLLEVAA